MSNNRDAEVLPASLVAVIKYVPSKSLFRPERVRFIRSLLNTPVRLEKLVVRESTGMLKLVPSTAMNVHWMFPGRTSGEAPEMTKAKVTFISSKPTIHPRTASTVGGTEGRGEGKRTQLTIEALL